MRRRLPSLALLVSIPSLACADAPSGSGLGPCELELDTGCYFTEDHELPEVEAIRNPLFADFDANGFGDVLAVSGNAWWLMSRDESSSSAYRVAGFPLPVSQTGWVPTRDPESDRVRIHAAVNLDAVQNVVGLGIRSYGLDAERVESLASFAFHEFTSTGLQLDIAACKGSGQLLGLSGDEWEVSTMELDPQGLPSGVSVSAPLPALGSVRLFACADFDGDGLEDQLMYGDGGESTDWHFLAAGDAEAVAFQAPLGDDHLVADFATAGQASVVFTPDNANSPVWLRFVDGEMQVQPLTLDEAWEVVDAEDLDGDGRDELLVRDGVDIHALSLGTDGVFSPVMSYASPGGGTFVGAGDLNGDGRGDLLFSESGGRMHLLISS